MDLDSTDTWRWIWLVAAVALAFGELAVPGTFFVFSFAIGAAIAAIASFAGASALVGWICFVGGTAIALAVLVPVGRRMNQAQDGGPVGATRFRDQIAVVLQEIPAGTHATGIVRVQREEWRAENEAETAIPVGAQVRVLRVDGTRVVVRQIEANPPSTPTHPTDLED